MQTSCGRLYDRNIGDYAGKWDDDSCYKLNAYICKSKGSQEHNPPPPPPKCDDPEVAGANFLKFNGACYKWMTSPLTWIEAENACKSMNSHLVSIIDAVEQAYIFTQVKGDTSWTGLNNRQVGVSS